MSAYVVLELAGYPDRRPAAGQRGTRERGAAQGAVRRCRDLASVTATLYVAPPGRRLRPRREHARHADLRGLHLLAERAAPAQQLGGGLGRRGRPATQLVAERIAGLRERALRFVEEIAATG